ncbi:MAG: hypothetical protein H0V22_00945, partial [Solirubrobacterales bacterium]|nr:hypothetical protein [Solirubrobacterales bacterium]
MLDRLTDARCRLVLVRAPAGWGKSDLLAEWSGWQAERRSFAWLALDDGDNEPLHFLLYLVEALRTIDPGVGTSSLPMLLAPGVDLAGDALPGCSTSCATCPKRCSCSTTTTRLRTQR